MKHSVRNTVLVIKQFYEHICSAGSIHFTLVADLHISLSDDVTNIRNRHIHFILFFINV